MLSALNFAMPGGIEWIVILLVALLLFGSRLPKVMRGLGSSVKEFREGMDNEDEADKRKDETPSKNGGE